MTRCGIKSQQPASAVSEAFWTRLKLTRRLLPGNLPTAFDGEFQVAGMINFADSDGIGIVRGILAVGGRMASL